MGEPRDERVTAAYRELPGEGPPPSLDAAIQAAARRAVGSRPGGTRRWQVPISLAAVLALAVGVSLQVERKKPLVVDGTPVVSAGSAEYPVPAPAQENDAPLAKQAAGSREQGAAEARPEPVAKPSSPAEKDATTRASSRPDPAPAAASRSFALDPPRDASATATSPPVEGVAKRQAAPTPAEGSATRQSAPVAANAPTPERFSALPPAEIREAPVTPSRATSELSREATSREKRTADNLETPESRLERIAALRSRGLHEEADRALTEFRRAYPGYRISEEWLKKIERR